ncbi:MAG: hypothetical protein A4S12_12730 [Proteobacteria bacterium SG_bin5]|nr:hypothetical protein [Sphingomonas sp.]OQW45468.1 MAG: hypothetical protein A4S12_12730 [Proteobacteria bacterium SG_bin5]
MLFFMLAIQTADPAPPPRMSGPVLIDAQGCVQHGLPDEVTVCARRDNGAPYRLTPLAQRYEKQREGLPRAAARLGPGQVSVDATSVTLANGVISQRAMLTFRLPF